MADTGAEVAPIVKPGEVPVSSDEENGEAILDLKAKLYRFGKDGILWKERDAHLEQHNIDEQNLTMHHDQHHFIEMWNIGKIRAFLREVRNKIVVMTEGGIDCV